MTSKRRNQHFVVVGAQRTGTNLLREVLNTNPEIAMLGEVFSPSEAPAHWTNFLATLPFGEGSHATAKESRALLERYFAFVDYRIRNHWSDGDKSHACAIGLDIKYNQLRSLDPPGAQCIERPLLIQYLKETGAIVIHIIRHNVIHSAVSAMIAEQRGVWHDYAGTPIDRKYTLAPGECLARARQIIRDREAFLRFSMDTRVVDCSYEDLVKQLTSTANSENIQPPGPLLAIAKGLDVTFHFRPDVRLRKAINLPYSNLIANHSEIVAELSDSEFADLAGTLI